MASFCTAIVRGATSQAELDSLEQREGLDIDWRDQEGRTALHYACSGGDVSAVAWLLQHGANLNTRQNDGANVLHVAASEGHSRILSWLNAQGHHSLLKTLSSERCGGSTPHQLALANGHVDFARLLEELVMLHAEDAEPPPPPLPFLPSAPLGSPAQQGQTSHGERKSALGLDCSERIGDRPSCLGATSPADTTTIDQPAGSTAHSAEASMSGFEIVSAYSVAGLGTCVEVKHRSFGLHMAFDMGTSVVEVYDVKHVFVSHSHIDHIGGLLSHARARSLSSKGAKYYVPESALEALMQAKAAYEAMDGAPFAADITGVKPGDVLRIHPNVRVVVFPTVHRVGSVGYALMRRKTKGLKEEYKALEPRQLGELRRKGVEVVECEDIVELAYTGDTLLSGIVDQDLVMSAKILLLECTYLDGDPSLAHAKFHVHLQDIVEHAEKFRNNEIILFHFSRRYMRSNELISLLTSGLPPSLLPRVGVALTAFGRQEPVSVLEDLMLHSMMKAKIAEGLSSQAQTATGRDEDST